MDPDWMHLILMLVGATVGGALEMWRGTKHDVNPLLERVAGLEGQLMGIKERLELIEQGYREPGRDNQGRFKKK